MVIQSAERQRYGGPPDLTRHRWSFPPTGALGLPMGSGRGGEERGGLFLVWHIPRSAAARTMPFVGVAAGQCEVAEWTFLRLGVCDRIGRG